MAYSRLNTSFGGGVAMPPQLRSDTAAFGSTAGLSGGGGYAGRSPVYTAREHLTPTCRDSTPSRWASQSHHQVAGNGASPRVASFVRLNSFLLRTHITSLVSALAEDGWLEIWEKERLCRYAREDAQPWALAFLRIYSRFMENDDVQSFVADLRAQVA